MGLLQEKYKLYREPQKFMEADVYPYFREITGKQGTEVQMGGHNVLMFGSNAYTGLTGDPRVEAAAKAAIDKYGTGCAGSRFLNGTLDLHVQLEKELAEFEGKDEALVFSTGFSVCWQISAAARTTSSVMTVTTLLSLTDDVFRSLHA